MRHRNTRRERASKMTAMRVAPHAEAVVCLPVRTKRVGKWYVASSPALDLHGQGHSKDAAVQDLQITAFEFCISCYKRETLDQVLCDAGLLPLHEGKYPPQAATGHKGPYIRIPIPLSVVRTSESTDCDVQTAS